MYDSYFVRWTEGWEGEDQHHKSLVDGNYRVFTNDSWWNNCVHYEESDKDVVYGNHRKAESASHE